MPVSPSGRFVLRIPAELHGRLKLAAQRGGLSLNDHCKQILERACEPASVRSGLERLIREWLGDSLIGIVLFGSAARGELMSGSDLDLLVVVDEPISRALYRKWDEMAAVSKELARSSHPVSPHFVRLPSGVSECGGIWLEAAIEGEVLWDRGGRTHRFLIDVRRAIMKGEFERSMSHGHPYWIRREAI